MARNNTLQESVNHIARRLRSGLVCRDSFVFQELCTLVGHQFGKDWAAVASRVVSTLEDHPEVL